MKKLTIPKKAALYAFALFLIAAIIYSCKKDQNLNYSQLQTTIQAEGDATLIANAKAFFNDEVNKPIDPSQKVGKIQRQLLNKIALLDSARVQQFSFGKGVVIPVSYEGNEIYNSVGSDLQSLSSMTRLLIYKDKLQKMHAEVVTRIPNKEYLNNNSTDKKFSGMVSVEDWQGNYLKGFQYKDGDVLGELGPPSESNQPGNPAVNDLKKTNDVTICITLDWYQFIHYEEGLKDKKINDYWRYLYTTTDCFTIYTGGSGNGGGGNGPSPADYPTLVSVDDNGCPIDTPPPPPYNQSIDGKKVDFIAGNNSCGHKVIINLIKDPCLYKMVNTVIIKNVSTAVGGLINSVFGQSSNVNIVYYDATDLGAGIEGQYQGYNEDANGNVTMTIALNKNTMPNTSQEYIATVIMHESIHAYLAYHGLDYLQHEVMAVSYVTKMGASLKQMFPGLSDTDAENLALGGLQSTATFKNTISSDMNLDGQFEATQLAYSLGSSGTRCN